MQICSDHQIIAGCFAHSKSCIQTCENKTDLGCKDAGMWGFVRECPVPKLSPPRMNEGWSNVGRTFHEINKSVKNAIVKADLKSSLGTIIVWILGVLLFFLVLCLILYRISK